jgi:hypothetical protein
MNAMKSTRVNSLSLPGILICKVRFGSAGIRLVVLLIHSQLIGDIHLLRRNLSCPGVSVTSASYSKAPAALSVNSSPCLM